MSTAKKTVKIKESDLVNLIDNIVTEAISVKKKEWIAEQAKKGDKLTILEQKIEALEAKLTAPAAK